MKAINCRGLSVSYNGSPIITDVDLDLDSGEWIGIVGPNGAGKSTILRALTGQLVARGLIELRGLELGRLRRREIAAVVAVVPQRTVIPNGVSVFDYVLLGRTPYIPYWGVESAEDLDRVRQALVDLELVEFSNRMLSSLSGGERQRAILARALAQDAQVLILDEPTTGLDLGHQQRVLALVDDLRRSRGLAVLSAVHDLTLAARYVDRLVLLAGGAVVAEGVPRDVLTPDRIEQHFGATVRIFDDGGLITIVPA